MSTVSSSGSPANVDVQRAASSAYCRCMHYLTDHADDGRGRCMKARCDCGEAREANPFASFASPPGVPTSPGSTASSAAGSPVAVPPRPLPPPVPPFPTDLLPATLRDWVRAEARAKQVPEDLVGWESLAALSLGLARRLVVSPWPGWTEPVNLYVGVLMDSGTGKSPVHRDVWAPVAEAQEELRNDTEAVRREQRSRRRMAEKRLEKAEAVAVNGKGDPVEAATEVRLALDELALTSEPDAEPRLFVTDITPEAIGRYLAGQRGRGGIVSDEGGVIPTMLGRYAKLAFLDPVLQAHSGGTMSSERVGRGGVEVPPRSLLTICLTFQPVLLAGLSDGRDQATQTGLLPRFLWAKPDMVHGPVRIGHRQTRPAPVPDAIGESFRRLIYRHAFEPVPDTPAELGLDAAAVPVFERWLQVLEMRLRPGGDLTDIAEWAGKAGGQTLRLAANLHVWAQPPDGPIPPLIPAATVYAALGLIQYAIPHAKAVMNDLVGGDSRMADARLLAGWLLRTRPDEISIRDAQRGVSQFRTAEQALAAAEVVVDHGGLTALTPRQTKPGRPPSPHYRVNLTALTELTKPGFCQPAHIAADQRERGSVSSVSFVTGPSSAAPVSAPPMHPFPRSTTTTARSTEASEAADTHPPVTELTKPKVPAQTPFSGLTKPLTEPVVSADKTVGDYSDEWDTDDTPDLDDPVPVATQPLLVTELPEPRYDRPCTVHQAWPNDDFRCEAPRCPGSYAAHGERPAS